jgi:uncharacterized protein (DUF4415 family)
MKQREQARLKSAGWTLRKLGKYLPGPISQNRTGGVTMAKTGSHLTALLMSGLASSSGRNAKKTAASSPSEKQTPTKASSYDESWVDPDDAPKLTEEWFEEADFYIGEKLIRRGRPAGSGTKQQITLRLDKAVIEAFRKTGPGWQARMNDVLARSAKRKKTG